MKTLYGLDLMMPSAQPLGNQQARPAPSSNKDEPDFSWYNLASPLGFWFGPREAWPEVVTPLRLEVFGPDERDRGASDGEPSKREGTPKLRSARARLKLASGAGGSSGSSSLLVLDIDANNARVEVDAGTWPSVDDAVLSVVAQFWRFQAIDRALDELTAWARRDLGNGGLLTLIRRRRSRELHARRRNLQTLILNLPDFESLLTNPRAHLPQGRPNRLYRSLAAQIGLGPWRRQIDERVEVVEAVYDSLAESLNHFQALTFQVVLELVIVAVLLFDAGLYLLDALGR
jgi:hypothetical protein